MKSYTDLEQSKKLAKILLIESADMYYPYFGDNKWGETARFGEALEYSGEKDIPCWSLSALLSLMVCPKLEEYIKDVWDLTAFTDETLKTPIEVQDCKNPVDACYEMIVELKEVDLI